MKLFVRTVANPKTIMIVVLNLAITVLNAVKKNCDNYAVTKVNLLMIKEYVIHLRSFIVEADNIQQARTKGIQMLKDGTEQPTIDFVEASLREVLRLE